MKQLFVLKWIKLNCIVPRIILSSQRGKFAFEHGLKRKNREIFPHRNMKAVYKFTNLK